MMEETLPLKINRTHKITTLLLMALPTIVLFAYFNQADQDLWGHMRFGHDTYINKTIASRDTYSYAQNNLSWINHEWLAEIVFYLIYKAGNNAGLIIFKTIIGLLITLILWKINQRQLKHPWHTSPIILMLAASAITFGFALRPQIFTYLFFTLYLYILSVFQRSSASGTKNTDPSRRDKNILLLIPAIMVLWVNMHGGFLAGVGILATYTGTQAILKLPRLKRKFHNDPGGKKLKYVIFIFCLTIMATLLTPYGIGLWIFLAKTLMKPRPYLWEWMPVDLDIIYTDYALLIIIGILSFVFSKNRHIDWKTILLVITLAISLRQVRHIPFFAIAAAAAAPAALDNFLLTKNRYSLVFLSKMNILFLAALSSLLICFKTSEGKNPLEVYVNPNYYPVRIVEFLEKNALGGNLLADFDWGEYCIWKLTPRFKIFVDGRYKTVYTPKIIDGFFSFARARENWPEFLKKYPHQWILISRQRPVVKFLAESKEWMPVLASDKSNAILMVKKGSLPWQQLMLEHKNKSLIYPRARQDIIFP